MTLRDNGVKAIEELMKKKGRFDYILLETTGLADPGRFFLVKLYCTFVYCHCTMEILTQLNVLICNNNNNNKIASTLVQLSLVGCEPSTLHCVVNSCERYMEMLGKFSTENYLKIKFALYAALRRFTVFSP